jgi:hypothetical protein
MTHAINVDRQALNTDKHSGNRAFEKSEKKPQNPLKPLFPGVLFPNPLQRRTLANRRFDEARARETWKQHPVLEAKHLFAVQAAIAPLPAKGLFRC